MNSHTYCANCLVHGWEQVEDETKLLRCKKCKLVYYCGLECQAMHWKKLHKVQCKYFTDPGNAQQLGHKEDNCLICRQMAIVGKSRLVQPNNPNYGCVYKELDLPASSGQLYPFSIPGQPADTTEKAIMVLWNLMHKFQITQPGIVRNCEEGMLNVFASLLRNRFLTWEFRKVFPHPEKMFGDAQFDPCEKVITTTMDFITIDGVVEKNKSMIDPFELWKTILLVHHIFYELYVSSITSQVLKDPTTALPEFRELVSQCLANRSHFLAVANQVLDALSTQVIPFKTVLTIFCGGSLNQTCSFCSEQIVIAGVSPFTQVYVPTAFSTSLSMGIYSCARSDCLDEGFKLGDDSSRLLMAVSTCVRERQSSRCDFCFSLAPPGDVHRCSGCLTTMYCTKKCQNQDRKIHQVYCKEDTQERKTKLGGSGRRKKAREAIGGFQKAVEMYGTFVDNEVQVAQLRDIVDKCQLKNTKKKSAK